MCGECQSLPVLALSLDKGNLAVLSTRDRRRESHLFLICYFLNGGIVKFFHFSEFFGMCVYGYMSRNNFLFSLYGSTLSTSATGDLCPFVLHRSQRP